MIDMPAILNREVQRQIRNFTSSNKTESKSETGSFKITASQKMALRHVAELQKIGVSQLVHNSIELYLELLPHVDALRENVDVIGPVLERIR